MSKADRAEGVWVTYYHDGSGFVVFAAELDALRHALDASMAVKFARFGDVDWMKDKRSLPGDGA
jgi:hypothetical protein